MGGNSHPYLGIEWILGRDGSDGAGIQQFRVISVRVGKRTEARGPRRQADESPWPWKVDDRVWSESRASKALA